MRQIEIEMRRLAGLARIDPIDVPALGENETQAEPEGLARLDGADLGDKRHLGMRRLHRSALERMRGRSAEKAQREKWSKCSKKVHKTMRSSPLKLIPAAPFVR